IRSPRIGNPVENIWVSILASFCVSRGFKTRAFSLAGHTWAQLPQPVQSSGLIWTRYLRPLSSLPLASAVINAFGASLRSSLSASTGLLTAWGHTNEHWLHWMQFSGIHSGTLIAIPLFSYLVVAGGNTPPGLKT